MADSRLFFFFLFFSLFLSFFFFSFPALKSNNPVHIVSIWQNVTSFHAFWSFLRVSFLSTKQKREEGGAEEEKAASFVRIVCRWLKWDCGWTETKSKYLQSPPSCRNWTKWRRKLQTTWTLTRHERRHCKLYAVSLSCFRITKFLPRMNDFEVGLHRLAWGLLIAVTFSVETFFCLLFFFVCLFCS